MAQMTALRRRMIDDMTVRNLSPATQQSYVYAVAKFSRFFGCSPDLLGIEEVRAYQLHLAGLGWSWSHINQVSVQWGPHGDRLRTSEGNWKQPPRWAKAARGSGERPRVFCASLADWLDNKAPQEWRVDLAALIAATPELDWLLLTKRPENYKKLAPWKETPPNVWLGVTGENQEYYDRRWKILQVIPARVRFISYVPALGPLTDVRSPRPDWIICGGQSGRKEIKMDEQWARDIRDICAAAGVAFFMKQMTNKAPIPADLMVRQFPAKGLTD